jgi:hypothetical protein
MRLEDDEILLYEILMRLTAGGKHPVSIKEAEATFIAAKEAQEENPLAHPPITNRTVQ